MFKRFTKGALLASAIATGAAFGLQTNVATASEPFIGQIQYFGFNFNPRGWALCNGQLLPINQNAALFSLLGTIYGGDGRTNFALPDMRGRAPLHFGQGPGLSNRVIGSRGGSERVTLSVAQMPSHSHSAQGTARGSSAAATSADPTGNVPANLGRVRAYNGTPNVNMTANAVSVTVNNNGGNQSHPNMQPFLTVNCSIALVGLFPSRN